MRSEASKNAALLGQNNVSFHETPSSVPGNIGWINSFIVFQHIATRNGLGLFDRLIDLLAVGGVISTHFTYARRSKAAVRKADELVVMSARDGKIEGLVEPNFPDNGKMLMFDYDLNKIIARLQTRGFEGLSILFTDYRDHFGVNIIGQKEKT